MTAQPEFFDLSTVTKDTPRLAWMKRWQLETYKSKHFEDEDEPWVCWSKFESSHPHDGCATTGETEHDAITKWAIKKGIRLWNEEQA